MTQLYNLSIDVLQVLTSYLPTKSSSKLWLAGDKHLQTKLGVNGVVQRFDLCLPVFVRTSWPSLAPVFANLTYFRFEDPLGNSKFRITEENITALPQTLLKIVFRAYSCYRAFRNALASSKALFPNLISLSITEMTITRPPVPVKPVVWPNLLRKISLHIADSFDVAEMPPALESFTGHMDCLLNQRHGYPSSLTSLTLNLSENSAILTTLLPAGLKTLIIDRRCDIPIEVDFSNLPRGLTCLKLPVVMKSREILEALPKTLLSVDCLASTTVVPVFEYWPPELEHPGNLASYASSIETVKRFPRTLRSLKGAVPIESLPHLPVHLGVVSVYGSCEQLDAEMKALGLQTIPTQMHTLRALIATSLKGLRASILPPSLTSLQTGTGTPPTSFFRDLSADVRLKGLVEMDLDWLGSNEFSSALEIFSILPPTLTKLTCGYLHNTLSTPNAQEAAKALPRTLTYLSINSKGVAGTTFDNPSEWFAGLPAGLKYLSLGNIYAGSDASEAVATSSAAKGAPKNANKKKAKATPTPSKAPAVQFPPALEQLYISFKQMPNAGVPEYFEGQMPETLTKISITTRDKKPPQSRLTNEHMKRLPKYLEHLILCNSMFVTNACEQFLPRSLQTFHLGGVVDWFTPYALK